MKNYVAKWRTYEDAYMKFYDEKEPLYLETNTSRVGLVANPYS